MGVNVEDMAADFKGREYQDSTREAMPVRQQSINENSWLLSWLKWNWINKKIEEFSFDKIAIGLIGSAFLTAIILTTTDVGSIINFDIQGSPILITIALMSAVFTLLSVRERKRDREASVAPTLFIGKQVDGKYGILNLGNGPAHELSVKATTATPINWDDEEAECGGEILCVGDFFPLEEKEKPKRVKMKYRSNVGYKEYDVTREVLSDGEN